MQTNIGVQLDDPELEQLKLNKEGGYNFRERRQDDWLTNYDLYRGKVTVNRLTQRQSVHVPLMKQLLQSILKDIDDMAVLYFENLDHDKQKELIKNQYWKYTVIKNNLDLQDLVGKKQAVMFGRTFTQIQIADGYVKFTEQDPQDILVSRYTDPVDLNSSRFLIHTHIFRSLSELKANPKYDKSAIAQLEDWYKTEQGLIKVEDNQKMMVEKNKKMADMGLDDVEDPILGEPIFELSLHFVYRQEEGDEEEQLYVYVEAEDMVILMKDTNENIIGKTADNFWRTHYPYDSWAVDLERQDFWSDAPADIIRPTNKILDAWLSQLVENRTLRNFGMHYYDTTANEGNWSPNTYNPTPWGWYGVPGDPNKIVKKVDIPELSESLDEIQFLITLAEKATGATPTQQGNITERQITLGEVQLALGEAKERVKGLSKFYTNSWKNKGLLFLKMIEAGSDQLDIAKIQAKGRTSSNVYEKEIKPSDFMSGKGYTCKVWSQDEKDAQDAESLQKLNAVKTIIPGNIKLDEIYKRKLLEFADLEPDEINDVMQEEEQMMQMMPNQQLNGEQGGTTMAQPGNPNPQLPPPNPVATA